MATKRTQYWGAQQIRTFVKDNPNGPSTPTRWHSHEDCPSICRIASEVSRQDLEFLGLNNDAALCGLCKRRAGKGTR